MKTNNIEIGYLISDIENKINRSIKYPSDFEFLSSVIDETTRERLSISTLKRIWKYVNSDHDPRESTLTTLARFIGFTDWDAYRIDLFRRGALRDESLQTQQIRTNCLMEGDTIFIGWDSDSNCKIKYLGDNKFEVLEASDEKIQDGDTFNAVSFNISRPLIITNLIQRDFSYKNYMTAEDGGLTVLEIISSN